VGKSSLLNALIPALQLRVAAVSGRLQRGRHTTRHVELFALGSEALLADTPGFNRPDLPLDPTRLASLFPELRKALRSGACRYRNCLHRGDPGCCVGTDWDRYPYYLQAVEELLAAGGPGPARRTQGPEVQAERAEVRLDRRQRQPSRRRLRQGQQEGLSPPSPPD
jgi:ribosome biogenesis GTPase